MTVFGVGTCKSRATGGTGWRGKGLGATVAGGGGWGGQHVMRGRGVRLREGLGEFGVFHGGLRELSIDAVGECLGFGDGFAY